MPRTKAGLTEKLGLWYFNRIVKERETVPEAENIYVLTYYQRTKIDKIVRSAVFNAALVGLLSSVAAFLFAYDLRNEIVVLEDFILRENLIYLAQFIGLTLLLSIIEMLVLFFDTAHKTVRIVETAKREFFRPEDTDKHFARIITRAAFELPNPRFSDIKIDPLKESHKFRRFFITLIVKAKASITKFFFKTFIQKAIGKTLSRVYFTVLSIPVVAFWNAFEAWQTIIEVKIRVLGPAAVNDILSALDRQSERLSYKAKLQIIRAVTISIIVAEDLHPNLELLYKQLVTRPEMNIRNSSLDNRELFLERFKELDKFEKKFVLNILEYSTMLSNTLKYRQRKLLKSAFEVCDLEFDVSHVRKLRRWFRQGRPLGAGV